MAERAPPSGNEQEKSYFDVLDWSSSVYSDSNDDEPEAEANPISTTAHPATQPSDAAMISGLDATINTFSRILNQIKLAESLLGEIREWDLGFKDGHDAEYYSSVCAQEMETVALFAAMLRESIEVKRVLRGLVVKKLES